MPHDRRLPDTNPPHVEEVGYLSGTPEDCPDVYIVRETKQDDPCAEYSVHVVQNGITAIAWCSREWLRSLGRLCLESVEDDPHA